MAKTESKNPVIGTVACSDSECNEIATVHQVNSGTRKGQLYLRCTECGCDQRKSKSLQKHITENADFREGHEHLSVKHQVQETEPNEELETEATESEELPPEETKKMKPGFLVGAALTGFGIVGIIMGIKK